MSGAEQIIASVRAWFASRAPQADIWEPVVESYFDMEAARVIRAPDLLVDDGDLLFVLFVPSVSIGTRSVANEALRDVTTHLKLLFRSLRDLQMNRLLVGIVYARETASLRQISETLPGLSSVDRLHRLVLIPPLVGDTLSPSLDEALGPLTNAPVAPFLRPTEPEAVRSATAAVLGDPKGGAEYPEIAKDLEQFAEQMAWGDDGPWPRMSARLQQITAHGLGGPDV